MKEIYEYLELDVVAFAADDVIATSQGGEDDEGDLDPNNG